MADIKGALQFIDQMRKALPWLPNGSMSGPTKARVKADLNILESMLKEED